MPVVVTIVTTGFFMTFIQFSSIMKIGRRKHTQSVYIVVIMQLITWGRRLQKQNKILKSALSIKTKETKTCLVWYIKFSSVKFESVQIVIRYFK